ncbi:TPA: hypothetical protein ACKF0Y_000455 [Klebsiella quasipneumoniae]
MAFDPPLGSTSPAVLLDNATRLDNLLNSLALVFPDRSGADLDTWRGIMSRISTTLDDIRRNLVPLSRQYMTLTEAQADIANIPPGSATFVRSTADDALADEYINISGTLTATGKRGQAHRDDLTTGRIEDGSREPEMKKAAQLRSIQYGDYYNQYRTNTHTQSASPMTTMILLIDAPE